MWFCICFLTLCALGVLDLLRLASAAENTSVRSTPKTLETPKRNAVILVSLVIVVDGAGYCFYILGTLFDELQFWSGESLKVRRDMNNCSSDSESIKSATKSKSGRRHRNTIYGSQSREEKIRSTKFALMEMDHTSHAPEASDESYRSMKLNGYTLFEDMTEILKTLNEKASVHVIAKTVEFHDIVVCKISNRRGRYFRANEDKYVEEKPEKKIILIVHGLAAMGFKEVPCLYRRESFTKLLKMYMKHLDKFDIFLIPMGNPDGIADETLQMWNKNKSPQEECSGVAIDRNFDVGWNKSHSYSSCAQYYPGSSPFSEPESRAVADLIHRNSHRIAAYIHVHAGAYTSKVFKGDAVLHPSGHKDMAADDKYTDIEAVIEEAMRNAGFKVYGLTLTSMYKWYGKVQGTSVDYATGVYGIPYGLEFVMQPYEDRGLTTTTSEEMQDNVLTEVWRRVIDVVFHEILKGTTKEETSEFK